MISIAECVDRGIYRLRARNLEIGVFDLGSNAFIGVRGNLGARRFLDHEYHIDVGGSARALELVAKLPDEIEARIYTDPVDKETLRPVAFDAKRDSWGWYWKDTGKPDEERVIRPRVTSYEPLLNYLESLN